MDHKTLEPWHLKGKMIELHSRDSGWEDASKVGLVGAPLSMWSSSCQISQGRNEKERKFSPASQSKTT